MMSNEFHKVEGYRQFYQVLMGVISDRPVTGEPVTDAIRDLLIALEPLELEVALQRTEADFALACHANFQPLQDAVNVLMGAVSARRDAVNRVVHEYLPAMPASEATEGELP
jgi:hypothetical protein